VWVEPLFGEAKEWYGLGRFRLRRLEKVNTEALMIASGQNVKRLLAFGTASPRRAAQVAALRRPESRRCGFHDLRTHRESRQWCPARTFSTRWKIQRTSPLRSSQKFGAGGGMVGKRRYTLRTILRPPAPLKGCSTGYVR
jgi:hypothetical protein